MYLLFNSGLQLQSNSLLTNISNFMDTVNLTCEFSGFPLELIQINWTPLLSDRQAISTDVTDNRIISVLTISSAQLNDSNLYNCTASLEALTGDILFNLTVGM